MSLRQFQRTLGPSRQFLDRFRGALTTRLDGSSWPRNEDTRRAGDAYIRALLLPGERKSMQPLARAADASYDSLQQFVTDSPWDPFAVMERGAELLLEDGLVSPRGLLVLDEVGWVKQGKSSVGVGHQYCGAVGKTANCQVAVDLVYAIPGEPRNADTQHFALAMMLYLPERWVKDAKRRKATRIPPRQPFRTKTEIGLVLVDLALKKGLPFRALTGDATYGSDGSFRAGLRARGISYALGIQLTHSPLFIPEDTPLELPGRGPTGRPRAIARYPDSVESMTAAQWAKRLPNSAWKTVRWSEGSKGTNLSQPFARVRVRVVKERELRKATDETGWLLLEQRHDELKAYFCWGLDDSTLKELVRIAHGRWVIEQFHQQMKGEVGFDHFEGRTWPGWHHHAAMVMLAYNYLQWARVKAPKGEPLPTLPEVHRQYLFDTAVLQLKEQRGLSKARAEREAERLWPWFKPG